MTVTDRIKAHPAVHEFSDERRLGDGCWVFLNDGLIAKSSGCTAIHEDTPSACLRQLNKPGNVVRE